MDCRGRGETCRGTQLSSDGRAARRAVSRGLGPLAADSTLPPRLAPLSGALPAPVSDWVRASSSAHQCPGFGLK